MEAVYKLWEGSWADDAVAADPASGVYARPERVRPVRHDGPFFKLDAVHLSEPSPQVLAPRVAAIRELAAKAGRDPASILMFGLMTVIVAGTDAEAAALHDEYRAYADVEGSLALLSGWTGVDFSTLRPGDVVEHVENEAGRSALENITRADPSRRWTVREAAEHISIGGMGPVLVGSASTVADRLEQWIEATDLDGFNLAFAVRPESMEGVVDLLVPERQRRGRYKRAYAEGPLRRKLFGEARLGKWSPAARVRWPG